MSTLVFEGTVFSGKGEGKKFVSLPWVKQQIEEKLGFTPYSGTLNLRLTKKSAKDRKMLEASKGIGVEPQSGYFRGVLFEACISGLDCAVVIPIVPNYPRDVLEVIAPIYLRGYLRLVDGSSVAVAITA